MRLVRSLCIYAACLLFAGLMLPPACASGQSSVSLSASPEVILADGKSRTVLTATVRDGSGRPAPDGTSVRFTTTLGTMEKDAAVTTSGVARDTLTSASSPGTALVNVTSFSGTADGSSTGSAHIEFTNDRDSLFDTGARWIRIECPQYLVYSADDRLVEAEGHNGSAHLHYKSLDIFADALQVDVEAQTLLARNALVERGRHQVRVAALRYDLSAGTGTAVLQTSATQGAQSVSVTGYDLETVPLPADDAQTPLETNPFRFEDISASRVIISARAIDSNAGDQIQFRRASIYADGKKLVSLAFHVMPMNTDQLFGQQVVGVGSEGIFLNIPYYYQVTPHSTGTIYLRNSAVSGANLNSTIASGSSFFTTHAAQPGLALDLQQTYSMGRGGTGQFSISGITRSEWGAQWTHTQRIDEATSGYFFVDYPSHRSLYASSNLSREFNGFSLNMSATGSHDPGFGGYTSTSATLNTYLQTNPRQLGASGISFVTDLTAETGELIQSSPGVGQVKTPLSTRGVDVRLFTAPLHPDRKTQITDGLTIGQEWGGSKNRSAPTVFGTLALTRAIGATGQLRLNYTYRYDPLFSQVGTTSSAVNPLESLVSSDTQQRVTLDFTVSPLPRLIFTASGGFGLPLHDRLLFTSIGYRVNRDWGLGLVTSQENYLSDSYRDTEVSVSRRILGRDLVFYYSTKTKKLRFDLAGSSY